MHKCDEQKYPYTTSFGGVGVGAHCASELGGGKFARDNQFSHGN